MDDVSIVLYEVEDRQSGEKGGGRGNPSPTVYREEAKKKGQRADIVRPYKTPIPYYLKKDTPRSAF